MQCPTKEATNKWIDDHLGLKYKFLGRDLGGVDCLGLVVLFYRDMLGVELPDPVIRGDVPLHERADFITSLFHKVRLEEVPIGGVAYCRRKHSGKLWNHCMLAVDPPRYFAQMSSQDGLHRIHIYDCEEIDRLAYYALRKTLPECI